MSHKVTLGGERLGSGKKMDVELHGYERTTFDKSYLWRSTMAAGTLVPFMKEIATPGSTWDIDLNTVIKTHPTVGPLFGSYKVQLDVFLAPIRLYNAMLHNNTLGIGLKMSDVKLPLIELTATPLDLTKNLDNQQVNPSSLLAYLGIRGVGRIAEGEEANRTFNAVPILMYWDIYKNYYANKQEEIGAFIHTPAVIEGTTPSAVGAGGKYIPLAPTLDNVPLGNATEITLAYAGTAPNPDNVMIETDVHGWQPASFYVYAFTDDTVNDVLKGQYKYGSLGTSNAKSWRMRNASDLNTGRPAVATFALENIDKMREEILSHWNKAQPFYVNDVVEQPYNCLYAQTNGIPDVLSSQEGLGLKTYQSDVHNNWLQTEWIDGPNGINAITAIDTTGGVINVETIIMSRKLYDVLNRVAVSGGSYSDWVNAVYEHDKMRVIDSPMYMGGLIKELVFQEVVSNTGTSGGEGEQPLGTLAGKGVMSDKHKGGKIVIRVDEPSYIMGIISLTPRVDYSQGNDWDVTQLKTMDNIHKPGLDAIGFQELITERMAWWSTEWSAINDTWVTRSAGKQPAWINYMTNVNKVYGNFAIEDNEMFMTLNRRYEPKSDGIKDLTTYIDPSKFNHIFAETALDAQNFWTQISVNIEARQKMSGKIIPNL